MVRKHNPGGYLGLLASSVMVHNRYKPDIYELRWICTPDDRVFLHLLMDPGNLREQAIFRTVCPWTFQLFYFSYAYIDHGKKCFPGTILDLGDIDIFNRDNNYSLTKNLFQG